MNCNIVVLISGSGSNLQALIDASNVPPITAVISNKADAFGLQRAANAGISTQIIAHQNFATKAEFEQSLSKAIDSYQADLVVLAGFMRILSPEFAQKYYGRILNIHPSLLPKFKGLHTHQRAIDAGEKEHGATVHFVTGELDGGPIVMQQKLAILPSDNADTLAQRVLKIEHQIYPKVVSLFAAGRLKLKGSQVLLDNVEHY